MMNYDLNPDENLTEAEDSERKPYQIKDLAGADWVFRKIKSVGEEFEEKKAYAEAEIKRYEEFLSKEKQNADDYIDYLRALLMEFVTEEQAKNPKFKLNTAVGSASFGKVQKKWRYDDDRLLNFLEASNLNDFIRVQKSVNKALLKDMCSVSDSGRVVTPEGELIEGVEIYEERNFNIKLK